MKAVIVDDEPLARSAVRNMLRRHADIEIAAECESGTAAIDSISSLSPDLVFLDVEMPEIDGFAVLQAIGWDEIPHVVFVTAYPQYAVRAFESRALDYLLKPFDQDRFDKALQRARERMAQADWSGRAWKSLHEAKPDPIDRFIVREAGRVFFLPARDVHWIEAQGNYVLLHARSGAHLFREPMASLSARLDARQFRRIHRSTIVNLDSIRELRPCFHGDYEVVLIDATVLKLSHRFRANLEKNAVGGL